MASEAKETARLYAVLTDKLGADTTEAMFKYIENKAERAVESKILSLATKNDIALLKDELHATRDDLHKEIGLLREDLHKEVVDVRKEIGDVRRDIGESKADTIKWMFIFWIAQVGATLGIVFLFLKK